MGHPEWNETKKECEVNEAGELVTKKVTLEAKAKSKKLLGIESKDFFDLSIKLLGLVALVFTALNYFNGKDIQEKAEMEKVRNFEIQKMNDEKKHSENLRKDSIERIKYLIEQNRNDSLLKYRQLEVLQTQLNNENELKQRQLEFNKYLGNAISSIGAQKSADLEKEKATNQLSVYSAAYKEVLQLQSYSPDDPACAAIKKKLFIDSYSQIMLFSNKEIVSVIKEMNNVWTLYENIDVLKGVADSTRYLAKKILDEHPRDEKGLKYFNLISEVNRLKQYKTITAELLYLYKKMIKLYNSPFYDAMTDTSDSKKVQEVIDKIGMTAVTGDFLEEFAVTAMEYCAELEDYSEGKKANVRWEADMLWSETYFRLFTFLEKDCLNLKTCKADLRNYFLKLSDELGSQMVKSNEILLKQ